MNGEEIKNLVIPNSVINIGNYIFNSCTGLKTVTIPNSVTSIGNYAFGGCTSLNNVTIGNSVTSIGIHAFSDCSALSSIDLGNSVTSIGNYAFYYCGALTSLTIPNSVTTIGSSAFSYCTGLITVTLGRSVSFIGSSSFSGCTNIEQVFSGIRMIFNINKNVFSDKTYLNAMLYVPSGRKAAYKAATGWQNFVYMEEWNPSGIKTINRGNGETMEEVEHYNASGIQINKSYRGMNIIRMSDGTVKKVIVK